MKAIIFFFLILLFTIPSVRGQIKIGDNPQNIDPASVLELESSSKVLVITRVTTAEMDAILPQRGGIVYNTDAECIFYFDGASWINLCDAIDFTITNDPIVNNRSTIAITQSNEGYNLEVAKNSILGNNIVDGGIGAVDIADNSITQDKLAENSVGSSELRENSVGSIELRERSIQAVNIAEHTPGHILITDENGIVVWQEADALKGAIADEFTITGDGTLENRLELSEGIQLNISNNTTLIADHIVADEDTDDTNELVDLSFDKLTNTLSISKSATPNGGSVNLEAVIGSDDQELTLNNNFLTLEEGGTPIDLTTYLDNTDEQTLSINGNILSITGGNDITLPAGAAEVDGDVRNELQDLAFDNATSILTLTNPGTPGNQVNLSGLAGGGITSLNDGFILLGNGDDEPTEVSIDGDATMNNIGELTIKDGVITPANIEPLTPTPTANQMLITNTDGVVTWAPAGSGTSTLPNGNIFIGNDLSTAIPTVVQGDASLSNNGTLTLLNKVVEGANIADETIVLENLNQNGATNGQIIKWNQTLNAGAGAWTVANDLTDGTGIPTLANGTMLIGSNTDLPDEVTISGDATIANTGILTIADDAITLDKLSNMGADDGEVLKWNQTALAWEPATDETGAGTDNDTTVASFSLTDTDADGTNDALTLVDSENVVLSIPLDDIDNDTTISAFELTDTNADGTDDAITITDSEGNAISIALADINSGTNENLALNNLTQTSGQNRTYNLNGSNLAFTGTGNIGIGNLPGAPQSKLDVAGQIQVRDGIASNNGTEGQPSLGFYNDPDTGIYRSAADEIGFTVGGFQAMRIDEPITGNTNVIVNQSLQLNGVLLDGNGEAGTAGQILSSTGTLTDWVDAEFIGDGDLTSPNATLTVGGGTDALLGDVTIDIAPDAVTAAMLNADIAGTGLTQNASGALEIDPSTIEGNSDLTSPNATLTIGGGTDALLGDVTIDIATDAVTAAMLNADIAGTGLTQNASGALEIDPSTIEGNSDLTSPNATLTIGGGTDALLGDVTIDIATDAVTAAMLNADIAGIGLSQDGTGALQIEINEIPPKSIPANLIDDDPTFNGNVTTTGSLDVGTTINSGGNLTVGGTISTTISGQVHPDYVFQKYFLGTSILNPNYEFKNLIEIEKFVKQYNHLPGVQSAVTIKEQGFWDLGESSRINLEKIEELFLHTIEQEKKIKALEASNKNMATELQMLKQQMEEIKNLMLAQKKE